MKNNHLGWLGVVRLGLVQTALGAVVVLTTSTINRVIVVELALPVMLPGILVAMHYAVQILRPRIGYSSDIGGQRTPWIISGMAVLALGGIGAAVATAWMANQPVFGIGLAVLSFLMIGIGVGAAGTSLLVLLAKRVAEGRRAAAATIVWVMMIAGFAVTAGVAGHFLDPYSPSRLVLITSIVAGIAFVITLLSVWGVEKHDNNVSAEDSPIHTPPHTFRTALQQVWAEPEARRFTIFVFISMLAYSGQDLILEPFAGTVFGLTPGESTQLAGLQHGGVLAGMLLVAFMCSVVSKHKPGALRQWTIGGCIASALALAGLAIAAWVGPGWPLRASVFILGIANGAFAVAAIGSMMALAGTGRKRREGMRMGLWGAAQAIAFGLGGFLGASSVDLTRALFSTPNNAYAVVFSSQAVLFLLSAMLAVRVNKPQSAFKVVSKRPAFPPSEPAIIS